MIRMDDTRIPKIILYSERTSGLGPMERQKKLRKDHFKSVLKSCHIDPDRFEALAADRNGWRRAVVAGVVTLEETLRNARECRKRVRHIGSPAAVAGLIV